MFSTTNQLLTSKKLCGRLLSRHRLLSKLLAVLVPTELRLEPRCSRCRLLSHARWNRWNLGMAMVHMETNGKPMVSEFAEKKMEKLVICDFTGIYRDFIGI